MGKLLWCYLIVVLLTSCQQQDIKSNTMNDLSGFRSEFFKKALSSNIEEAPFGFNYSLRTIFFSKNVVSLFAELTVQDRLPHGKKQYEGKTFYKSGDQWRELHLGELFHTQDQKETLRKACENGLKNISLSYFSGNPPLRTTLAYDDIDTFVIDSHHLIIVFQPYSVGGRIDTPFTIKIPLTSIQSYGKESHSIFSLLAKTVESDLYISCWDSECGLS